jgi:minor extracellular serine protease Vpr
VKKLCILLVFFLFLCPIHEVRIVSASESGKIIRTDDQLLYERIKNSSEQVNLIVVLNPLVKAESGFALLSHQVPLKLRYVYREVCHGLAVSTRGYHLRALLFSSLVEKIYLCQESFRVSRNRDAVSVKAEHVWKKLDHQKRNITGKGIKVGMIDTGIDDQHGDFSPTGVGENSKIRVAINIAEAGEKAGDLPFYPHGTHVGGIIAGNNPRYEEKKGLAPESTLYVYRVFSKKGIVQLSDILGGIEQAIIDRVDVVNLSIGFSSSNPISSNPQEDPFFNAIKRGIDKGIVFCGAAGNAGARNSNNPWPILAPGLFETVIQPAASDDRLSQLLSVHKDGKILYTINALPSLHAPLFDSKLSHLPIVDCAYGRTEDFDSIDVLGKIALISRGPKDQGILLSEKNLNAKKAGAVACIIYNYEASVMKSSILLVQDGRKIETYDFLPSLFVSGAFADRLKKSLKAGCAVSYTKIDHSIISDFTSVGPCASGEENVFKPDLCFPGKQVNSAVLSVVNEQGEREDRYDDWDGTSMATAGTSACVALLKQAHPDWTPDNIKSALMNNADILSNPINQEVFPFFNQGAGQVNILQSLDTPLLINPPTWMNRYQTEKKLGTEFELKNTLDEEISCSISLEVFNLRGNASPFQLMNRSFSIAPKKTITLPVELICEYQLFQEERYEGVLWVSTKPTDKTDQIEKKLHIPVIIYRDKLSKLAPTITDMSIKPDRISQGEGTVVSFAFHRGSFLEQNNPPTYLNHAQQMRIFVEDSLGKERGEIFYGENLFIGHYQFLWDGKNTEGIEFLPNGKYHLVAEISGSKPFKQILGDVRVIASSIPQEPLLIVSSASMQTINRTFPIDLYLLNPVGVKGFKLKLTFSKSALEIVSFVANKSLLNSDSIKTELDQGLLFFESELKNKELERIKLGTLIVNPLRQTSPNIGINLKLDDLEIYTEEAKEMSCGFSIPLVVINKIKILRADFNQDQKVDQGDYELLMERFNEDFMSDSWDPRFDLNNDLTINMQDVFILAREM